MSKFKEKLGERQIEKSRELYFLELIYNHSFSKLSTLDANKKEICECIAFKFYLPSITYTNFFFERLMKYAIYLKKTSNQYYSEKEVDEMFERLDREDLSRLINKCRSLDLINDKELEKTKALAQIRNGFSHANYKKIFRDKPNLWKSLDIPISSRGKQLENIDYNILARTIALDYFVDLIRIAFKIDSQLSGSNLPTFLCLNMKTANSLNSPFSL